MEEVFSSLCIYPIAVRSERLPTAVPDPAPLVIIKSSWYLFNLSSDPSPPDHLNGSSESRGTDVSGRHLSSCLLYHFFKEKPFL